MMPWQLAAIIGPIALFAFLMIRYVLFATPASELAWAKWIISLLSPSVRGDGVTMGVCGRTVAAVCRRTELMLPPADCT